MHTFRFVVNVAEIGPVRFVYTVMKLTQSFVTATASPHHHHIDNVDFFNLFSERTSSMRDRSVEVITFAIDD